MQHYVKRNSIHLIRYKKCNTCLPEDTSTEEIKHVDTVHSTGDKSSLVDNSSLKDHSVQNVTDCMEPATEIQPSEATDTIVEDTYTTPAYSAKDPALQTTHIYETRQNVLSEQYLGFMIHNSEWLIPLEYVKRIVIVSENEILPQCSESIMGVLDTDEGVVPIVNSITFYSSENCCAYLNAKNTIILCCLNTNTIGLFVHSTTRIYKTTRDLSVYQNAEMEVHMATTYVAHPCVSVMLLQNERLLPAIDMQYIFEQIYHPVDWAK